MKNTEYTARIEAGNFDGLPTEVPIHADFVDDRGIISNLLLSPITSVAVIDSDKRAVRANHYHKTDWHYAYVVRGRVLYFDRAVGSTEVPEPMTFGAGQMFFTPPNREHAMLFAEDTTIFTFAKNVRSHENHEADLVRVEFVTPEIADRYVP